MAINYEEEISWPKGETSGPTTLRSMPAPCVPTEPLSSADVAPVPKGERGIKFDGGKVRTDLLPAGAVDEVATAFVMNPMLADEPWSFIQNELAEWRGRGSKVHGGCGRLAIVAAGVLVLLTRELRGDVRIDRLLPACGPALFDVARVLTFGAQKYGPNNWQGLADYENRYYAALLRHLYAFGGGEAKDPESGLHHLAHAGCCALFLLAKEVGFDPHT